jgi:hypothetical protein
VVFACDALFIGRAPFPKQEGGCGCSVRGEGWGGSGCRRNNVGCRAGVGRRSDGACGACAAGSGPVGCCCRGLLSGLPGHGLSGLWGLSGLRVGRGPRRRWG